MGDPKRILVVDDDDLVRGFVEAALTDKGYEVVEARDGAMALTLLGSVPPDLILLDMRMPGMNGWDFAAAYHQRPGPRAPIVVLTAAADAASYAAQINAEAYLSKPFRISQLFSCVAQYAN
jgi:two-component system chemotaxis response regulator CheY